MVVLRVISWSNIYNVGQNHMFTKADSMLGCFGLDPNKKLPDSSQISNSKWKYGRLNLGQNNEYTTMLGHIGHMHSDALYRLK